MPDKMSDAGLPPVATGAELKIKSETFEPVFVPRRWENADATEPCHVAALLEKEPCHVAALLESKAKSKLHPCLLSKFRAFLTSLQACRGWTSFQAHRSWTDGPA
jgi:hypothetical protein